jgi:succinoglycan biosynthesis protein ExoA
MTAAPVAWEDVPVGSVAAVMVVRDEPAGRMARAVDALAAQRGVEPFELVVAAPRADHERLRTLRVHGAVCAIVAVENPGGARSAGLNAALRAAGSEIVVRVDARSIVPEDYVVRCVARLQADAGVGVVGGVQHPEAPSPTIRERGIVRALRNRWMLGNAAYRNPGRGGCADTVYLGAFRRDELLELGGYDERLGANEDFELCARYRARGRAVWLEPELVVGYEPRDTLRGLGRQYHEFGAAKVRFWRATGRRPNARQWIALGVAAGGAAAVAASLTKPRRLAALGLAAAAGVALVDHLADPGEPDPRVRMHAWIANCAVIGGWLSGVASGVAGRRSGDVEHPLQGDAGPLGRARVDRDLVDDLATHQ